MKIVYIKEVIDGRTTREQEFNLTQRYGEGNEPSTDEFLREIATPVCYYIMDSAPVSKDFIEEVRRMRQAQKEYFKTRSKDWLLESKKREAYVDKMLKGNAEEPENLFTRR